MNRRIKTSKQTGFTIVELMIASTVFSVVLLMVSAGIVQIGNTFYRGTLQSRTQETARNVIDEISRGIQFSGQQVVGTGPQNITYPYPQAGREYGFCINGIGYSFMLDRKLAVPPSGPDQTASALVSYEVASGGCSSYTVLSVASAMSEPNAKEMLGRGMRLTDLLVQDLGNGTFSVSVGVASGDRDLFIPDAPAVSDLCAGGRDSRFCAVSKLTTTVQKRVK